MVEIAERCELSKAALYLYFHNKEDLARAVVIENYDALISLLETAAYRAETGLEKVGAMLDVIATVYTDNYRRFYLSFVLENHLRGNHTDDDSRWAERAERQRAIHHLAADAIRRGMADGSIRPGLDPDLAAITAINAAEGFVHRLFLFGEPTIPHHYSATTLIETFSTILINALLPTERTKDHS